MIHILTGEDSLAKDERIEQLKKKYIKKSGSSDFDFETLHGHKLNKDTLKQALIALPAVSSRRVVLLRQAEKMSAHNKTIILEILKDKPEHLHVIFEAEAFSGKDKFFRSISKQGRVEKFSHTEKTNLFDMTRAMSAGDTSRALKILFELLKEGNHPLQIIGGLIWFWGKCKNRVSRESYHEGLQYLQELDLNIKRSRIKPEYALEVLVVKLTNLI